MMSLKIYSLSSFQIYSTGVLINVIMLYITSSELIFHTIGNLYILTPFTYFFHHAPSVSGNHQSFLFVRVCFLDSIYINTWDHTVCIWIISLNALKFYPCCYTLQDILFYDWILLHIYATSLFVHQWTLMLFPNLDYCK